MLYEASEVGDTSVGCDAVSLSVFHERRIARSTLSISQGSEGADRAGLDATCKVPVPAESQF